MNGKKDSVLESSVLEVDSSFSKGTGEVSVVSASELTNADMTSSDLVLDESALTFGAPQKESRSTEQSIKNNTEPVTKKAVALKTVSEGGKTTTQPREDGQVAEEKGENAAESGPHGELSPTIAIKKVQSITEDEQGKVELDLCGSGKELCNGAQEDKNLEVKESTQGSSELEEGGVKQSSITTHSSGILEDRETVTAVQDNSKHSIESGKGTSESVASSVVASTLLEGKKPEKNNSDGNKSENQSDWVDILGSGELQKKVRIGGLRVYVD